jgi:phosphatidylglycerol:prolipoprotein diacylglycerol transferase
LGFYILKMKIPFEPIVFGFHINIHLIFEILAFFISYRYYKYLKNKQLDIITNSNRSTIVLAAAIGVFIGSRIMGILEQPLFSLTAENIEKILNVKTIMGGLFGGLLAVEFAKRKIGEKQATGDLFTFPIILGIFIGRIGCFLMGTKEFTYGNETNFLLGMNLGDGTNRHPVALYELIYLIALFIYLKNIQKNRQYENGLLFQLFMISYFGFRFFIEFIKPNIFYIFGLSSIQILCIVCWIYYRNTLIKLFKNAYKRLHLL